MALAIPIPFPIPTPSPNPNLLALALTLTLTRYLPLHLAADVETGEYDGATWRLGQGWLSVQPSVEAGLFAHARTVELINTATLSGRTVEREVGVRS